MWPALTTFHLVIRIVQTDLAFLGRFDSFDSISTFYTSFDPREEANCSPETVEL
jgi:hypothetical protein